MAYERLYLIAFGKDVITVDENIEIENLKKLIAVYQKAIQNLTYLFWYFHLRYNNHLDIFHLHPNQLTNRNLLL